MKGIQWLEASWLGAWMNGSTWVFPVVESVHLVFLALLGGSVLLMDLRLLGVLDLPMAAVARGTKVLTRLSLVMMIVTGFLLFASETRLLFENAAFQWKIGGLMFALGHMFLVRDPFVRRCESVSGKSRWIALVSILLWLSVAVFGRWVGFS